MKLHECSEVQELPQSVRELLENLNYDLRMDDEVKVVLPNANTFYSRATVTVKNDTGYDDLIEFTDTDITGDNPEDCVGWIMRME